MAAARQRTRVAHGSGGMGNNKDIQNVSKATIGRLPAYHRYLKEKEAEGERTISSTVPLSGIKQQYPMSLPFDRIP